MLYGEFKEESGKFKVPSMREMEWAPYARFGMDDRAAAELLKKIEETNKRLDAAGR